METSVLLLNINNYLIHKQKNLCYLLNNRNSNQKYLFIWYKIIYISFIFTDIIKINNKMA